MEGVRLILMDGTIIEDGTAGYSDGFLWLYLPGWTIQQAIAVVLNPSAMGSIIFQYGDMEDEYLGYTVCKNISQNENEISVCMVKG